MNLLKKSLFIGVLGLTFSFFNIGEVFAATIQTNQNCSFVNAVLSAESNTAVGGCTSGSGTSDTIVLNQNITLNSAYQNTENALPVITTSIAIEGNNNTVTNDHSGGLNPFRIFELNGGSLTINNAIFQNISGVNGHVDFGSLVKSSGGNLNLKNISSFDFSSALDGGAIYSLNTLVSITKSLFQFSGAERGGVLFMEGGQKLSIVSTEMKNNSSLYEGGAVTVKGEVNVVIDSSLFKQNASDEFGALSIGFLSNQKSLIIKNSEFEKNYSSTQGAVGWGGWQGKVSITGTTFFDNKGFSDGASFVNHDTFAIVDIINSTFSYNESFGVGSAILNRGEEGQFTIAYTSFVNNNSNENGGTFTSFSPLPWISSRLENNIFSQNVGGDCNLETEVGLLKINNLSDDGSCGDTSATGVFDTVENNGGPTRTHKLIAGSNAIDTAVTFGARVKCPKVDQRGYARMIDGNSDGVALCDIGAYEYTRTRPSTPATVR